MSSFLTNRMAFGRQPGLKSVHVAWNSRAVRGSGRIKKARLRGLCVAGSATDYLGRREAAARREGDAAVETAEVVKDELHEQRTVTASGSREAKLPDEQRETMKYEGGTVGKAGEVGARGPDVQGGKGARRARATRGSYPAGAQNNYTRGHSAVAEGAGCAGPYPEGPLSCRGDSRQLARVWV